MYFAWRMSALQCCVSFCSPAVGLSCMFAYVCAPSLLRRPPSRRHPRGVAEPERSARALLQPPQRPPHPWAWRQSALLSPLVPVSTRLFFTPVSLFLPYTQLHQYHFCTLNILVFFFFPFRSKDHWVYYTIPVIQLLEEVKKSNLNLQFIDWTCLYILTTFNNNSKKSLIITQIQTAEIPTTNRTKPLFPPHNRV